MTSSDAGGLGGLDCVGIQPTNRYANVGYNPLAGYEEFSGNKLRVNQLNVPKGLQSKALDNLNLGITGVTKPQQNQHMKKRFSSGGLMVN